MITTEQGAEIRRRAEQWAAGLALGSDDDFHTAVESQLNRLTLPPLEKRRRTALALAEVGLTEASRMNVFGRKDTVSQRIFYGGDKSWYHGEEFRSVLEHLIALYKRWSAGATARKAAADFNERVDKLRQAEHAIGAGMFQMALQMVGSPLWEVEVTDAEGREVTWKPARWTLADLPRIADAASKLTRLSLDMAPGGRHEVAVVDWTEHLPDGITPAQAEAAMESWARLLAAEATAGDDEEDDE